jgi:large subunit ribosomal protein L23
MSKTMILRPRMSEKTYAESQEQTYVFVVPKEANKHSVARAVEAQFEVTVTNVNILNQKGKAKRTISKGGRRVANGSQTDIKKAYVTLAEGQSLPIFEAVEEAEAKEEKLTKQMEKAAEKAEKKAEKEAKKAEKKEKK